MGSLLIVACLYVEIEGIKSRWLFDTFIFILKIVNLINIYNRVGWKMRRKDYI